jgi:hypothetical protein
MGDKWGQTTFRGKWGQTTFKKYSENMVCPRFPLVVKVPF